MNTRRVVCVLLTVLLAGSAWANENAPPAYRPPLLMTVHDAQLPSLQCTATAMKSGDFVMLPLTLLASACAAWTADTCEIWAPQSGPAVAWSVLSSLMSPDMIIGHEAMHCWLHNYHGVLPWV